MYFSSLEEETIDWIYRKASKPAGPRPIRPQEDMTSFRRSTEQDLIEGSLSLPLPQHAKVTFLNGAPGYLASAYQTKTRRLLPILTEGWNSRHSSSKSGSTWWKRIIRKLKHPLLSQGPGPTCRSRHYLQPSLNLSLPSIYRTSMPQQWHKSHTYNTHRILHQSLMYRQGKHNKFTRRAIGKA